MGGIKIIITEGEKQRTFLLPAKAVFKFLLRNFVLKKDVLSEDEKKERKKQLKKLVREATACLKEYKAAYGSFVLVEAEEQGSERLTIVF